MPISANVLAFDRWYSVGLKQSWMIGLGTSLGAMTWMYRKLMEASELKGVSNGFQAARSLGMRPEQAEIALRSARKVSKNQLLDGLRALQSADDRLKSGGKNPRTVMEFLVAELTGVEAQKVGAGGSGD